MHEKTIAFYDSDPKYYSDSTFDADTSFLREPFASLLHPGSRILDFGCGSGRDSLHFHTMGFDVDPVDGSEGMCRIARENTGLPVRRMLFTELDSIEEYDGVWACSSLVHLSKEDLVPVFHRIYNALRSGGIFYSSFKDGDFQGIRDDRYYTDLLVDELVKLGLDCGFELVRGWYTLEPGRGIMWSNALFRKPSDGRT